MFVIRNAPSETRTNVEKMVHLFLFFLKCVAVAPSAPIGFPSNKAFRVQANIRASTDTSCLFVRVV